MKEALEIFEDTCALLNEAERDDDYRRVIANNGCLLLQVPTGAGKTLIAGHVAEGLSRTDYVVWFWFAPFAGLVTQSESTIRSEFASLRVRDIKTDRVVAGTRSGDVWVSTWAAVAAENKESRKVRLNSETTLALDNLIPALRQAGYRIGVVVDEAHHGFRQYNKSVAFYCEVLKPEYTLLITATPNDAEAEAFRKRVGLSQLNRLSISREEAVRSGLVKRGLKTVAFVAPDHTKPMIDFENLALYEGVATHNRLKEELANLGLNITPLLLVQVDSSKESESRVREKLKQFGVPENAIATHTAKEPDPNLLALAADETKEVLIFKMAVALGFDAPRAFTLVSMRGIQDEDFGVQIVGRLLRVDRRLQGRKLPECLQFGYVVLADVEKQSGVQRAGELINNLKNELSRVSRYTLVVKVGDEKRIQVEQTGQTSLQGFGDFPGLARRRSDTATLV